MAEGGPGTAAPAAPAPQAAREPALCIALCGNEAETLAPALAQRLGAASTLACSWLPDPTRDVGPDPARIADVQRRRIAVAVAWHDLLVCALPSEAPGPARDATPAALTLRLADLGGDADTRLAAAFEACGPLLRHRMRACAPGLFSRLFDGGAAGWSCPVCSAGGAEPADAADNPAHAR